MAATATGRPGIEEEQEAAASGERPLPGRTPRAAVLLGVALLIVSAYAAFASGATGLASGARVQVAVAVIALVAFAALLYGSGLHVRAPRAARWGVLALGAFTVWSALSVAWSVAPDQSWVEANRVLSYALIVGLGMVLGSSLPRAAERVGLGFLALVSLVAVYALGAKFAPWLDISGVIDLGADVETPALSGPFDSAAMLGLFCALGVPIALHAAASEAGARRRSAGIGALVILVTTIVFTFSRAGVLAGLAAVLLCLMIGPVRGRLAAAFGIGLLGAATALAVGLALPRLTDPGLDVSTRTGAGLLFGAALLVGLGIALALWRGFDRRPVRAAAFATIAVAAAVSIVFVAVGSNAGGTDVVAAHLGDTDSGNRADSWPEAWAGFADRPLEGYGAGSFDLTRLRYREPSGVVAAVSPPPGEGLPAAGGPQSDALGFLSETGFVGALLLLGALALLLGGAVGAWRASASGADRAHRGALLAAALAFGGYLLVGDAWQVPGVTLPALILLGAACARPPRPGDTVVAEGRRGRSGLLALGTVAAVAAALLAALPSLADGLDRDARRTAASSRPADLRAAERDAALAKRLNPHAVRPLFTQAAIASRRGDRRGAARLLAEAVDRQPDNPATWRALLAFQRRTGDAAGARRSQAAVLALDPLGVPRAPRAPVRRSVDPARSASAAGTPLPVKVKRPPRPKRQRRATPDRQNTQTPQPQQTTPTPTPTPTPAPTPTPTPTPTPAPKPSQPQGKPFRSDG